MSNYQFDDNEIERQFRDFMSNCGFAPADNISLITDGKIHRYKVKGDKHGDTSGSYCIYTDGTIPAGWAGDWHYKDFPAWHYDLDTLPEEHRKYYQDPKQQAKIKAEQKKREEERKKQQIQAAGEAMDRIRDMPDAQGDHPYLQKKGIYPYDIKAEGRNLAVPLSNIDGLVRSYQRISPDGTKRFYPGAPLDGLFWAIGLDLAKNPKTPILIGEGFATMAKIYELTSLPSVMGVTCGNLPKVAEIIHKKYPKNKIIIMADNDKATELKRDFNPGIQAAQTCVKKGYAVSFIAPEFDKPEEGTDWDDYALIHGDDKTSALLMDKIRYETLTGEEKAEFEARRELKGVINSLNPAVQVSPQEFIGGLFPRKFVSLLVAPPGTGKTIFMQKFVSELSIGGSILGGFAEDEPVRKSLIFAGEAGYELLIRRGAMMKWAITPENVLVVDQYTAETKDIPLMLDDSKGWANVLRTLDMTKPDIVFFDTFSSFHESDENKATEMKPIVKKLAALARDTDIAVVLVHHSRKRLAKERTLSLNQDDVIGSSIFNRLVGLIIGIEPMKDNEKVLLVRQLKSWFTSFSSFTFELKEKFYGGMEVVTDLAPASVNNTKANVWDYLQINFRKGEWFSSTQIILSEIEGNISDRTLRRILADLIKTGKLTRRGSTKDAEYALS